MSIDSVDIAIVGAGIVGLALAERFSALGKEVVLVEKYQSFGQETSSRNSEVIHAGLYYPQNTLKARLCVEGNRTLYEICAQNEIPHRRTGKLLVANTSAEEQKLNSLYEQGRCNGATLSLIESSAITQREPLVKGRLGLWSPNTGIVDTHQLMKYFETRALSGGVTLAYSCELKGLEYRGQGFRLHIGDADGQALTIQAEAVVNAAGLWSDSVAAMAGIDCEQAGYRLHWCKGESFRVSGRHRNKLRHLLYPVPTEISLGIHTVLRLDGTLRLGPNAYYVDTIDYSVRAEHQQFFYEQAKKYLPFLAFEDLSPDMAGIRPKLQGPNDTFRDFIIREESDRGLPGLFNLIGIESPGITSAPAIARYVEELYQQSL